MTNREWLQSLSDEVLADYYEGIRPCAVCVYAESNCMQDGSCESGILRWLRAEHKEI